MKLCIDCAHHRADVDGYRLLSSQDKYGFCEKSANASPVDGQPEYKMACQMRLDFAPCGPNAKLFEAKS